MKLQTESLGAGFQNPVTLAALAAIRAEVAAAGAPVTVPRTLLSP